MSTATKLQIKANHRVVVLGEPDDVQLDLGGIGSTDAVEDASDADAVIAFVAARADLGSARIDALLGAGRRDALAWVAYPKGGQLGTDLNRDVLAALLAERGVRPVRQIAIDDTWSALRFRPGD